MVREFEKHALSGWLVLPVLLVLGVVAVFGFISAVRPPQDATMIIFWILVFALDVLGWAGFFLVNPNEAKVMQVFG